MKFFRLVMITAILILICAVRSYALTVVDAGHGGADGGAVSRDGVPESPINLSISRKIADLLQFLGQETLETRTAESIDYPKECTTLRKKKVYDTKRRVELINAQADAVVISIHQNSLPSSPKTHGAMVFYRAGEGSAAIAERVQRALNETVNAGNEKNAAEIGKSVYLMAHIDCPAILVECGFLSNPEECGLLQTRDHQLALAVAVVAGYLQEEGAP